MKVNLFVQVKGLCIEQALWQIGIYRETLSLKTKNKNKTNQNKKKRNTQRIQNTEYQENK